MRTGVDQWVLDKPDLVRCAAFFFAQPLAGYCEYCNDLRAGRIGLDAIGVKPKEWLSIYRQPSIYRDAINRVIPIMSPSGGQHFQKRISHEMQEVPEASIEAALSENGLQGLIDLSPSASNFFVDIERHANKFEQVLSDQATPKSFLVAFVFNDLVAMPCWFAYETSVWRLYRQAYAAREKRVRLDALEKLVVLDTSIQRDDWIGEEWDKSIRGGKLAVSKRMASAVNESIKPILTAKMMKVITAAKLSLAADMCRYRLTAPEIRRLFDAIAYSETGRDMDTDIPGEDAAFQKAIARYKRKLNDYLGGPLSLFSHKP